MERLEGLKITPEEAAAIRAEIKKIAPGLMEKHLVALKQEIRSRGAFPRFPAPQP